MKPIRSVAGLALCMLLAACGASTGTRAPSSSADASSLSSGIVLRQAPPDLGCDSIGWEGEPYRTLTFHIDPAAGEQVWAESDTGAVMATYWSDGFQSGADGEPLVRDRTGEVFVTDGDVVEVPLAANLRINDYLVCLRPDKLYVLKTERG